MANKLKIEAATELKVNVSAKELEKRLSDLQSGFSKGIEDFKHYLNEDLAIRHFDASCIVRELEQRIIIPLFSDAEKRMSYLFNDHGYKMGIAASLDMIGFSKEKLKETFNISHKNPEKLATIKEQQELIVTDERHFYKDIGLEMKVNNGNPDNKLFNNGDLLTVLNINQDKDYVEISVIDYIGSVHLIYEENLPGIEIYDPFYKTDDMQFCRDIEDGKFEYVEYHQLPVEYSEPLFTVKHDTLCYADLSEGEIVEAISGFYDSLEEVQGIYGSQYKQIVVECYFENSLDCIVGTSLTEDECVKQLKHIGIQIDELDID